MMGVRWLSLNALTLFKAYLDLNLSQINQGECCKLRYAMEQTDMKEGNPCMADKIILHM